MSKIVKDFLGQELKIGDKVAFVPSALYGRDLREGTILKFAPKSSSIKMNNGTTLIRHYSSIIKIPSEVLAARALKGK